jgi:putative transcriptional regulator
VFLVARRGMPDPRFARTVILLVGHGEAGSLGLVVNRPSEITLANAFPDVEALQSSLATLWSGGPVAPYRAALLVNSPRAPERSRTLLDSLHFTTDFDVLIGLAGSTTPARYRVYAGHAGWAPGQLEDELSRGDWRLHRATVAQVLSDQPMELWQRLIGSAGTWVETDDGRFRLAAFTALDHPRDH